MFPFFSISPPSSLPAIIGAGASLVGGLINNGYAQARTDKQWERMNAMQDKMNAYNAPVAQMARLREAGLNPNLVYANGGAVMQSAVGNAPNPPNTAPIDTQGVLQMVQTIVGAMLEKDKIQATKDLQTEKITADKDMQLEQIGATKDLQTEKITADKEMQSEQISATDKIASENRKENARQFDEGMKQRISEFNARINLDRLIGSYQIKKINSDVAVNRIRMSIEQDQLSMSKAMHNVELDSALDSLNMQKLRSFMSVPYHLESKDVYLFISNELGVSEFSKTKAEELTKMHNDIIDRRMKDADLSTMPLSVYWDAVMGPVKDLVSISK
ncbi:DNA pilot protein [Microvirus sp.]|nr:DNA pilot protein [Microvirus sp.]